MAFIRVGVFNWINMVFTCLLLAGCFEFSGPLRQDFSLYRAVSQREGGRGEKG